MSALKSLVEILPTDNSAALIISPVHLRYLSGIDLESGILLASKEAGILYVTEDDFERLKREHSELKIEALKQSGQMLDVLVKYGIRNVYVEADKMTVAQYNVLKDQLHYAEFDSTSALDRALAELRSVKRTEELEAIMNAQKICDKAYERLLGSLRKKMSERQIASMLEFFLKEFGSDGDIVPVTVLSGENTTDLTRRPSDRQVTDGDMLILEFGANWKGYCAKMCRTCAIGNTDPKYENAYNAVFCAMQDGLKTLRAGVGSKVADSVAKSTLSAWNMDMYCSTTFGHGIGLEEIEPPFLGRGSSVSLKENTALFAKCGVSVQGKFGVKLGDMVVLTKTGYVNLTRATKSLVHI